MKVLDFIVNEIFGQGAIFLAVIGVAFLIVGTYSRAETGYGKTVAGTGRVFLWSGGVLLMFLILTMMLDISGVFN